MPPKKGKPGKKGKKKDDSAEPPHDPCWERAVETGVWEKSVLDLPDANTWPTWGALRERVLTACKEIKITNTASLRDAFCNEIVKLSPPELTLLDFHGSTNLRNFVLSPVGSCPKLTDLDLSEGPSLDYAIVQSQTLRNLHIHKCRSLTKVLIHCPRMARLTITDNPKLETIMIWSDDLTDLDLTGCTNIVNLKIQCPSLLDQKVPPLKFIEKHVKPNHPPISMMLKESYQEAARVAAEAKEREWESLKDDSIINRSYRQF